MTTEEKEIRTVRFSTAMLCGAILILTQLLITQWTVRAANSEAVVAYVSFSGTVTSMLLAVLAIVYSYYTTNAQKADADRIATQIGALTVTSQTLSASEARLSDELVRLEDIRARLDDVNSHVRESKEEAVETKRMIREFTESQARKLMNASEQAADTSPSVPVATGEVEFLAASATRLAKTAVDSTVMMLLAAYSATNKGSDIDAVVDEYYKPFLISPENAQFPIAAAYGQVFVYTLILLDLRVGKSQEIRRSFKRALADRLKTIDYTKRVDDKILDWSKLEPFLGKKIEQIEAELAAETLAAGNSGD